MAPGYIFAPSHSITRQVITFTVGAGTLTIEADQSTPLYEMIEEIVDYDCYQLQQLGLSYSKDSLVIDVGANVGVLSLIMAQQHPGQVVALEPIPGNVKMIRANLEANKLPNVSVLPCALAATDGEVELAIDPGVSVSAHSPSEAERRQADCLLRVRAISLPTLLQLHSNKEIDLLKMDCEGYEYDILGSVTPVIAQRIRNVTLEVHDRGRRRNLRALKSKLEDLGFRTHTKPEMFGRRGLYHLAGHRQV